MTATIRVTRVHGPIEEITLGLGRHVVGREAATISLGDPQASAIHAHVHVEPHAVTIIDAGSRNGTFDASGRRLTGSVTMQIDQPLHIGSSTITLVSFMPKSGGTVLATSLGSAAVTSAPLASPVPVAPAAAATPAAAAPPIVAPHATTPPAATPSHAMPGAAPMSRSVMPYPTGTTSTPAPGFGTTAPRTPPSPPNLRKWGVIGGIVMIGIVTLGLAMDHGNLSKGMLKEAINEKFDKGKDFCVMPPLRRGSFPTRVVEVPPLFRMLHSSGHVTIASTRSSYGREVYTLDLTTKGREQNVWDDQRGVCFGRPRVEEIVRWSEPPEGGVQVVEVTYTWHLRELPDWADQDALAEVEGFGKPAKAKVALQKMSDGWKIIDDSRQQLELMSLMNRLLHS